LVELFLIHTSRSQKLQKIDCERNLILGWNSSKKTASNWLRSTKENEVKCLKKLGQFQSVKGNFMYHKWNIQSVTFDLASIWFYYSLHNDFNNSMKTCMIVQWYTTCMIYISI